MISGGYELGASGGTRRIRQRRHRPRVFFSGGGLVQLDALLSQFAGVISGFDLGDEVDLRQPRIWFVIQRHVLDAETSE